MLRMTDVDSPDGPVLRVEGRIAGRWAEELRAACADGATLDLTWVTFVDPEGAEVLSALARRGVRMVRVPPFVATMLEGGSR